MLHALALRYNNNDYAKHVYTVRFSNAEPNVGLLVFTGRSMKLEGRDQFHMLHEFHMLHALLHAA